MDSKTKLGKNIKKTREAIGLTQEHVADKVGIHVSYLSRIERGVVNPSYEIIEQIAKTLKVKSKDIMPF
jgi:transcriptional regulator with XRE-family HTH domain